MNLSQRLFTGLAAFGLAMAAFASAGPAPVANAGPLPDVAVKYTGYNYGANGLIDVAFGITNKNADAPSITLNTTCYYHQKANPASSRSETGKIMLGLTQYQANPVPKLVTCVPTSSEYVSSVVMSADVPGGDADTSNNTAMFNNNANLPKPDVSVAYLSRYKFADGSVKALFGLFNNTKNDASLVKLHVECHYHNSATKAFSFLTSQDTTTSVPHQTSGVPFWANCGPVAGNYVNSVFLNTSVELPYIDSNTQNNTAYWNLQSMG